MKKGFTMIELIFVIVILGILASVAIPRLAGTRADAQIATTISNLRTILSEASGYYVAHGSFGTVKWRDLTNVPLKNNTGAAVGDTQATAVAYIAVDGVNDCITIQAVEKATATKKPAHIKFTLKQATGPGATGVTTDGVCGQVLAADAVKAIVNSTFTYNTNQTESNAIAIGSTTSVY